MAVGLKVTLTVQFFPAARLAPHLVLSANAPIVWIPAIVMGALPSLVRVTICGPLVVPTGWSLKFRVPADNIASGPAPVPVSETAWGLPGELSST